jgi:hypothetical protein
VRSGWLIWAMQRRYGRPAFSAFRSWKMVAEKVIQIRASAAANERIGLLAGKSAAAVQLVLEANRELAEQALVGQKVEREPFELAS